MKQDHTFSAFKSYCEGTGIVVAMMSSFPIFVLADLNFFYAAIGIFIAFMVGYLVSLGRLEWYWPVGIFAIVFISFFIYKWNLNFPSPYEGQISGIRQFKSGIALDLDGIYPNQKMIVFIPREALGDFSEGMPAVGANVEVFGTNSDYNGHREIIVTKPDCLQLQKL